MKELLLVMKCLECVSSQFKHNELAMNHSFIWTNVVVISFFKSIRLGIVISKLTSSVKRAGFELILIIFGKFLI
jgi:hypothetical protein